MSKRGHYGIWSENDLIRAVAAYKNRDYGLNECSRVFGVPKATIKRHADEKNPTRNNVKALGRPSVFSSGMEQIVSEHICQLEDCFFDLTINEVRKLAFDVAEKYCLPHSFNREKQIAGKKWFYSFLKRHPHLSFRKRKPSSRGFNRLNVNHFFDILEHLINLHKFTAATIFNVDESGFLTIGEHGVNTTMICAASPAGVYIPPMIIFKREQPLLNQPLLNIKIEASPDTSIVTTSDTGHINSDLFLQWLQHFQRNVNCNVDNKVLLLLDGHTTHSKNLHACEFARDNGIVLLQLPGYTTYRLQPLCIKFFGPLRTYFAQAEETFLHFCKRDKIDQTQMAALLNEAYGWAATVATAESAFRDAGIWPVNRHVFTDDQFAPATIPATPSSSDDDDDGSDNEAKRFKRVLDEISSRVRANPNPDGASTSHSAAIVQEAVGIIQAALANRNYIEIKKEFP